MSTDQVNRYLFNPTLVRHSRWTSLWNKCRIVRLILQMMGPQEEASSTSAPTEKIVACILDNESEILLTSKVDRSLSILCVPNVDTDRRNTSLLAWDVEGGVKITRVDGAVRE